MDEVIYQAFVRERARGEVYVAELLDNLCREWGLDPVETWRRPRQTEIDMAAFRARWMVGVGPSVTPPNIGGILAGIASS